MSGYLQRLVSKAQAPNTAIRPVLGSFFSSSVSGGGLDAPEEIEEMVVTRPRAAEPVLHFTQAILPPLEPSPTGPEAPYFRSPQANTRDESNPIPHTPESLISPITEISETTLPTPKSDTSTPGRELQPGSEPQPTVVPAEEARPHIAEPEAQPKSIAPIQSKPDLSDRAASYNIIFKSHPQSGEVPPEQPRESAPPRSFSPLLAESIDRLDTEFIRPAAALSSPRMAPPSLHQNKTRTKQEPDEIQIHIGRIEVTALPPAPVRPLAPAVRKSIKLDEYLRRGRGSA